jgi:hypothetical protein
MSLPENESETRARGFWGLLVDVFVAPSDAFREVARRPRFWAPLVAFTLLQGAFALVWLARVDIVEYARAQALAAGREAPPAGAGSEALYDFVKTSIGVSMLTFTPVVVLALAAVLMFVFNFVLGAETEYRQCVAIVSWASFAVALVSAPLTLLVLTLKGDWTIDPQVALASHLGAFLDPRDVSPALLGLAQSLDLLSFWSIFLLAAGMAQAARRSQGSALGAIGGLWLAYVLTKAGLAALF